MPTVRKYPTNAQRQAAYRTRRAALRHSTSIKPAPPVPGARRWEVLLAQAQELLADVAEEMAQYWDERSEAWQNSARGEQLTERITAIEAILDTWSEL